MPQRLVAGGRAPAGPTGGAAGNPVPVAAVSIPSDSIATIKALCCGKGNKMDGDGEEYGNGKQGRTGGKYLFKIVIAR